MSGDWRCECDLGWDGADCATRLETQCRDGVDNDGGMKTGELEGGTNRFLQRMDIYVGP